MSGSKLIATSDWRKTPSNEYRFFLYDPEGDGLMFFKSAEIRDAIAAAGIRMYCDGDGWSEEVANICAGEVTARAQATNVQKKPTREEFGTEEEFEDAMEEWPGGDFDETCTFELQPLTPTPAARDEAVTEEFTLSEMLRWIHNTHASVAGYYYSNMRNGKSIKDQIAARLSRPEFQKRLAEKETESPLT